MLGSCGGVMWRGLSMPAQDFHRKAVETMWSRGERMCSCYQARGIDVYGHGKSITQNSDVNSQLVQITESNIQKLQSEDGKDCQKTCRLDRQKYATPCGDGSAASKVLLQNCCWHQNTAAPRKPQTRSCIETYSMTYTSTFCSHK